jgi:hypothetical protein
MLCASNVTPVLTAPLRIPEPNYLQIANAAQWLCSQADREAFALEVRHELERIELGKGSFARGIAAAFLRHFNPPADAGDDLLAPRQLGRPKRGKYA